LHRRLMVPLAAASAVALVAVVTAVVIPAALDAARHGPQAGAGPAGRYVVQLGSGSQASLTVRSLRTAAAIATVAAPKPGMRFTDVASGDGRSYVAVLSRVGACRSWLYKFQLGNSGHPTALTALRVSTRYVTRAALSKDSRTLALATQQCPQGRQLPPELSAEPVVVALRRPGWGWAQRSLAVAAAVLVVVVVGLSALLAQSNSTRSSVDAQQAAVTRVLTAPDAQTVGGAIPGGGRGAVVVSASEGTAVFVGSHLAAPPSGHTYELWYVTGSGAAIPAGTFEPAASGRVTTVLDGTVGDATKVAMTVEPAGGSKQPTTAPIMAVPIA